MKRLLYFIAFLLLSFSSAGQNYITAYEYWFDNAYANHVNQSVVPQHQIFLQTNVNTTGLSKGLHTFNIRFQQTSGYWSEILSSFFYRSGQSSTLIPKINAYRYWVEGNDSVITDSVIPPVSPVNLTYTIDLSWIHKGSNYLYMQFRDEKGNWSVASVDSFYKNGIPVSDFTTNDTMICNSDSVHFINKSNDADIYTWHFGDGDSSNDFEPVHFYAHPGVYTVDLMVTDTVSGNDSIIIKTSYVHIMQGGQASFSFTQSNLQVTFINTSQNTNSFFWDFGDNNQSVDTNPVHTYLHDGNYTVVLHATDSCESMTDTLYVSILLNKEEISNTNLVNILSDDNKVQMIFHSKIERCSYILVDAIGRILISNKAEHFIAGHVEQFSIAGLASGVYFLRLNDGNKWLTKKIYKGR